MSLRVNDDASWADVQQRMRKGETLSPLLPLGADAAYVWIPKNGCTTLKRAWLQLHGRVYEDQHLAIHSGVLGETIWCSPEELREVAHQRKLLAIWRDPIDRFVSACRSHLKELTTSRLRKRLKRVSAGNPLAEQEIVAYHDQLLSEHGVQSFADHSEPAEVMNTVALQLGAWIDCHLDWSHHTLPQVSYLGGDPSLYSSILGMEQIDVVLHHWQQASGVALDSTPQHVSSVVTSNNPWRCLQRQDLTTEALRALKRFYAADFAFIALAQQVLGDWKAA
jgi:hypothetical protein